MYLAPFILRVVSIVYARCRNNAGIPRQLRRNSLHRETPRIRGTHISRFRRIPFRNCNTGIFP